MDYCTLEEVREELVKRGITQTDDDAITERLPRVKALIDTHCGHSFDAEAISDEIRSGEQVVIGRDGFARITVAKAKCRSVSAVALSDDLQTWHTLNVARSVITDDYVIMIANTAAVSRGGALFARVSYAGGYEPLPEDLRHVACRWSAFLYHQRSAPFEVQAFQDLGQLSVPTSVPADIKRALAHYRRVRP